MKARYLLSPITRCFFAALLLYSAPSYSQAPDLKMRSSDSTFLMEVVPGKDEVRVVLYFVEPDKYKSVVVEKCGEELGMFRQCAYINLKDEDAYGGAVVATDNYPAPFYNESFYRLRILSADGIERIYPPVRLPAVHQ